MHKLDLTTVMQSKFNLILIVFEVESRLSSYTIPFSLRVGGDIFLKIKRKKYHGKKVSENTLKLLS